MEVCYETLKTVHACSSTGRVFAAGPQYTNLTWTVSIGYIAHLVLLMLETSDTRTVLRMLFDIVTIWVITSLTDSLISSFPHITTLLNDTFVCFLFCWVLRVILWRYVTMLICAVMVQNLAHVSLELIFSLLSDLKKKCLLLLLSNGNVCTISNNFYL